MLKFPALIISCNTLAFVIILVFVPADELLKCELTSATNDARTSGSNLNILSIALICELAVIFASFIWLILAIFLAILTLTVVLLLLCPNCVNS